jgi:hypothetical protein
MIGQSALARRGGNPLSWYSRALRLAAGLGWRFAALLPLLAVAMPVVAQGTFDISVANRAQKLVVGFYSHTAGFVAGTVLSSTGLKVYRADFGDFPGGPRATDDPGFRALPGTLPPGQLLYARGEGVLQYRSGPGGAWGAPPAGELIRLQGAVPTDIAIAYLYCEIGDPVLCNPGLAAQYPFYAQGTAFSGSGISGPNPTIIDAISPQGELHAHLDWFIEGRQGVLPSIGAYMITLRLSTNGGALADSNPFHILFNHQLSAADFAASAAQVTIGFPIGNPVVVPVPAAGLLVPGGLLFLMLASGRFRTGPRSRSRSSVPARG